jgi:hypothetical protein
MSRSRRTFALALVAAAVAVTGCGGDEEGKGIPAATASALGQQLDGVQQRIDEGSAGACRDILEAPNERGPNKQKVEELIDSLPDDVDSDVRSALEDSFDRLWDLVQQECDDKASKEEDEKKTDTTPTKTQEETTPTETTPTETTPTETTPTETTPPSEEELPPGEGDGNGGGGGTGGGASPSTGGEG